MAKSSLRVACVGCRVMFAWARWMATSAPPGEPQPSWRGARMLVRVLEGRESKRYRVASLTKVSETAIGRIPLPSSPFLVGTRELERRSCLACSERLPAAMSWRRVRDGV